MASYFMQFLNNRSHEVKCAALAIISDFLELNDQQEAIQETVQLLAEYTHDHEPRVRTEALNAVVRIYEIFHFNSEFFSDYICFQKCLLCMCSLFLPVFYCYVEAKKMTDLLLIV